MVAGGVLASLGAWVWYAAFLWRPSAYTCTGSTCYVTIVEATPWYPLAVLPIGLALVLVGVVILARRGYRGPAM